MICTDEQLSDLLEELRSAQWVALDTEADSLHAYPEKLCLIQVCTEAGARLVDPLSGIKLGPLLTALLKHELIVHGGDYDLRLLRRHHEFVPDRVFDTMLAARLLGHRKFGLADLLKHYLGITLEKGSQKANWAKRPLTERMERYALADVQYLKPLSDRLKHELIEKGRLGWLEESCARLIADCAQPKTPNADSAWRLKGSARLDRRGLAVLRELWHWREKEALAANKPPYFILSHELLVAIAAAAADSGRVKQLVPNWYSCRRRNGLFKAVARALALPPDQQPEPVPQGSI
ncbi:MAG: ribonuclease D, partial [Verrucomicrobiae bacterium]|nr:ribonuclease D [Verrucomicrobiae bacterium]